MIRAFFLRWLNVVKWASGNGSTFHLFLFNSSQNNGTPFLPSKKEDTIKTSKGRVLARILLIATLLPVVLFIICASCREVPILPDISHNPHTNSTITQNLQDTTKHSPADATKPTSPADTTNQNLAADPAQNSNGKNTEVNLDIAATLPPVQTAVSLRVNANCLGFYKALAANYDSTSSKYPLIIFLHGRWELGLVRSDLSKVLNNGVPKLIKNKEFPAHFAGVGKDYSFIVISPQFVRWPSADDVSAVVNYATSHFRVDETRIYVSGLSMGGGAAWEYAAQYASRIAALVPICGASSPTNSKAKSIATANLPVWAFHNEDDLEVPVKRTIDYVNKINNFNPNPPAKMTIWATGGHDAWTKATDPNYKEDNMNMYEWMLQYHR